MKKLACLPVLFAALLWAGALAAADEAEMRRVIQKAKEATALVQTERSSAATAFCIDPSGWYVTNDHVFGDAQKEIAVSLVLSPGEANEKVIQAKVVLRDQELDLALLQAPGSGFPALPLGDEENLFETQAVIAVGYPFGRQLADKEKYPSATVSTGRITALRKSEGVLENVQLDNSLNPGNSGGPVIDLEGRVIGVVRAGIRGSGVNFAIPVSKLKQLLARPVIGFEIETMPEAKSREEQKLTIQVSTWKESPADRQVELELRTGASEPRQFKARRRKDGSYVVKAVLVPEPRGAEMLQIEAQFANGAVSGRVADIAVKVGDENLRLSEIYRIEAGPANDQPKIVMNGKILHGVIDQLKKIEVDFGGAVRVHDLTTAVRVTFAPIPPILPEVHYRILVRDGAKVIGQQAGNITIVAAQQKTSGAAAVGQPTTITPPALGGSKKVVKLPGPVDDVVVGGNGKWLILYLKKLQQLALFDVSQAKVVKYLPLASNDITYAAGARKLFIGLRDVGVIQRWDLETLEQEIVVNAPEGGIGCLAMGGQAAAPLILLGSALAKRSYVIDSVTMEPVPLSWKGWSSGAWGPTTVHASLDGTTAVVCGGGWAGYEVATFVGGKINSSQTGSSVHRELLLSGNGALVFPDDGGVIRGDLTAKVQNLPGVSFPAVSPNFSLAYASRSLTLFSNNDPKPITTIGDLPELESSSRLPIQKRVILIPEAHVLVTMGEGDDRLILREFDLEQTLDKGGVDYLFVASAPVTRAEKGKKYEHPIQVRSRQGGLQFLLQAGPEGMTITSDGVLTWDVPSQYQAAEAMVIVQVSDRSSQLLFHSFRLSIE